jgi:hypothetical protein
MRFLECNSASLFFSNRREKFPTEVAEYPRTSGKFLSEPMPYYVLSPRGQMV